MIICVSDNAWFRLGISELVQRYAKNDEELFFLTFEKVKDTPRDMALDMPVTVIVDYTVADPASLLTLLQLKRQKACLTLLAVTSSERIQEITENILLDSVADCLIDSYEAREKMIDFLTKGSIGQVVSKSITSRTWAMIKKNACLTHREIDLIPYIISGKGNKEISRQVEISQKMVSIHRRNIYSKLQVGNLTGLYKYLTASASSG